MHSVNFQSALVGFIIFRMSQHISVMLNEAVHALLPVRGGAFLDATFGGGGHTQALLESNSKVRVVALDCDPLAQTRADRVVQQYPDRFTFHRMNFSELEGIEEGDFNGALFDLGVSSFQLDEAARGFSFRSEAPVDMRMDTSAGISASEFLETAAREDLVCAVRDFGEEKRWHAVVEAIINARGTGILGCTARLAELVEQTVGKSYRQQKIHPATRTFQGVRIAVNKELESIERGLPAACKKLASGGRLAVISFHSLEDRLVKRLSAFPMVMASGIRF